MDDRAGSVVQKVQPFHLQRVAVVFTYRTTRTILWYEVFRHKFVHGEDAFTFEKKACFVLRCIVRRFLLNHSLWLAKRQNTFKVSALREFFSKIIKRRARENSRLTCCVNINTACKLPPVPFISCFICNFAVCLYTSNMMRKWWWPSWNEIQHGSRDTRWISCLDTLRAL